MNIMDVDKDLTDDLLAQSIPDAHIDSDGVYSWKPLGDLAGSQTDLMLMVRDSTVITKQIGGKDVTVQAVVHGDRARRLILVTMIVDWLKTQDRADEGT